MTLRVVPPGERKPRKLSVVQAAGVNDHRVLLAALRSRIAATVQDPSVNPVALAALSRQLVLISAELARLDATSGEDAVSVAASTPDEPWSGSAI